VLQSGAQYLFLPADSTPEDGFAVLLPFTSATRPESSAAGSVPAAC
jgi:hypothetical protein